ncbi:DNA-binding response regulator [bacterium CPR1]|nr:DNA-binding response regulator [bacterium CPR1]
MISVLLVDDHEVLRQGLTRLLDSEPDLSVVGQAGTGEEALELVGRLAPTLVTLDLHLPGIGGLETAVRLLAARPDQGVVIVSSLVRSREVQLLVRAGVRGYLSKTAPAQEIVRALRQVGTGGSYYDSHAAMALAESLRGAEPPELSARQLEILLMAARGLRSKEIADQLALSTKTVEKHRTEIFARLGVRNLAEALEAARRYQLLA